MARKFPTSSARGTRASETRAQVWMNSRAIARANGPLGEGRRPLMCAPVLIFGCAQAEKKFENAGWRRGREPGPNPSPAKMAELRRRTTCLERVLPLPDRCLAAEDRHA